MRKVQSRSKRKTPKHASTKQCRYNANSGRHCRRPRMGCLSVCKAHARHDAEFVTQDLAAAVRRIARTGDPAEVLKKLATYAQQQRMPLELAEMMMYTAHVLATHKDRDHIELWSRRIAEATLPESERTPELAFVDPEEVEEERVTAMQQQAAAEKAQTIAAAAPQPPQPANPTQHPSSGLAAANSQSAASAAPAEETRGS